MRAARPWLPANAARDETLAHAIEACAGAWARRWFARPKPISVKMSEVRDRAMLASDSFCWRHGEGGFTAALAPTAHAPIASTMLGLETGTHKLTPDDHRILRELAQICTRDLAAEVASMFGLSGALDATAERQAGAGFRYALAMGGATQLFEVLVSEQRAVEARGRALPPPSVNRAPLHTRAEALRRQSIRVGAMVGRGRVGLGELKRLSPGDVIVLDRGPDDLLDLAINGVAIGPPCSILRDGSDLTLRIDHIETGQHS
jgi:flagellar motor switch/type III secretory pathway protein FliN